MQEASKPKPGDRAGAVNGPGVFPRDNQGIVIAVYGSIWYSNIAVVLMDDGRCAEIVGSYNAGPGIGWHLISPAVAA